MNENLFLYEVYAFYTLFYGNNSFIRNITEEVASLNLGVDVTTNRTYTGYMMNYLNTQA